MGNDGRGKDDLGMPMEERIGQPPAAVPLTREFPPTDDELALIDKLRRAEHTGIDSLMLAVMNGRDIVKPFIINACLDLTQHVRRLEQQTAANQQNTGRQIGSFNERIAKLEKAIDEEFEEIKGSIEQLRAIVSDTIRWLGLAWPKRTRATLPKMAPAKKDGGAP